MGLETLVIVGFAALAVLIVVLLVKLFSLGRALDDGESQNQLIRIETRMSDMTRQAAEREKAIRDEFRTNREDLTKAVTLLGETVRTLGTNQAKDQQQFRDKLDEKMKELRTENSQKLDEMRKTVDEKLQTTLEKRLSESFKTVSERLEQVHKGLGEMQTLATGVGDLKRVLTNVKSRGTFGEVQLELLIEDVLTPNQYVANYDCGRKGTHVEFGIRMPGTDAEVYLPVDAKFPTEDYERLLIAVEAGDTDGIAAMQKLLANRVKGFAKDIATKYINPPFTTPSAILFLPTEGLYAEMLRIPGFVEGLQREFSVTVTGPTNFQVLLTTFRMGFQQMAMQAQAQEVWKVLGAVKNEFERYGDQISAMGKNVEAMEKHIEKLSTRRNQMLRALKGVEAIEDNTASALLGDDEQ
ncbi:DNA recombination protein RmuC [Kordiimonas sp.]|uniref:DNA recombination protein RmuC n=1 Tax=Kordiimonas sp. TaxID=1970157 RepID=UPI003A8D84B3